MNALYIEGKIEIKNNSMVNATSFYPSLFSESDMLIEDSKVVANATDMAIWSKGDLVISGDSDVIAEVLGAVGAFILYPKQGKYIEVISGSNANNASALLGSPFSKETDLKVLNIGNKQYFHSKPHTHVAGISWLKDTINYWHECTANDGEKMDLTIHSYGEWVIDTMATETTKGSKHRECICGQSETIEIPSIGVTPTKPIITAGAGAAHQISAGNDIAVTCSGKMEDLTGIYVNGQLLNKDNYTLKSRSTILTLKASYLDTLSVGKHILKFQYKDNISAETYFTITKKAVEIPVEPTLPKTSDISNSILYFTSIVFFGGIAILVL